MIKKVDQNKFGVSTFVINREEEVANLPKNGLVGQDSVAFVIETSNVFMYDEEANEWKAI